MVIPAAIAVDRVIDGRRVDDVVSGGAVDDTGAGNGVSPRQVVAAVAGVARTASRTKTAGSIARIKRLPASVSSDSKKRLNLVGRHLIQIAVIVLGNTDDGLAPVRNLPPE